ncbi:MAG: type II toxin-antitoxin system RelE/ParE family toxin [Candidatus Hydrogenedentes bacterium]|nr:type II toxin-antitoxin system RelE/ParE family toxin [Candidatus Hydrogenedentota bacterium]
MATVLWTVGASADLRDIFAFLRRDSQVYASVLTARIIDAVERLGEYPNLGRMVPEYQDETLREVIVGNYRVVYRVRGQLVGVIALVHGRQNLTATITDEPWNFG